MTSVKFSPIIGVMQQPGVPPVFIQHMNAVQENIEILAGQRIPGVRAVLTDDLANVPLIGTANLQQITANGSSSITTVAQLLVDHQRLIQDVVALANDVNALRNTVNSLLAAAKGA